MQVRLSLSEYTGFCRDPRRPRGPSATHVRLFAAARTPKRVSADAPQSTSRQAPWASWNSSRLRSARSWAQRSPLQPNRCQRFRKPGRQEEAALNNLILDLAAKRAFIVADDWEWADDEVQRVVSSVIHARDLIRETRLAARPRSPALPHLQQMTRACNTFLEWSERAEKEQLKAPLRELARRVGAEVDSLHRLDPGHVLADRPGSLAL